MKKFAFKISFALLVAFTLIACGVKRNSSGSGGGGGLIQIYTKGKDSLLCFAGPVEYKALDRQDKLEMDYTYLKVKDHSNPVVCNFSLITRNAKFRPGSIELDLNGKKFHTADLTKLFAEGSGKREYIYRYSFQVSDTLFVEWMQCEKPQIKVNELTFTGEKKFTKAADNIYRSFLFDLF